MFQKKILKRGAKRLFFWGNAVLIGLMVWLSAGYSLALGAESGTKDITEKEAIRLGKEFGVIVGKVDKEIQEYLGLTRPEGVVVFEVLGGKPADLAGIKSGTLIKEINSVEIKTLEDFGKALQAAMKVENFSLATYAPADVDTQGVMGGINFHYVRVEKS